MPKGNATSKTMLEEILSAPSDKEMIEQGQLPHGSMLHLETALNYARKIKGVEQIEMAWLYVETVINELTEIKRKAATAG